MLHKSFLLLIPFLSLSFCQTKKRVVPVNDYFQTFYPIIGPFEIGADDYELTGMIYVKRNVVSVREKMSVYVTDGQIVKTQYKDYHSASKGSSYDLTFTLPLKSSLTSKGLTIIIEFINNKDLVLKTVSFNIKPIVRQTINPKLYLNDYFINEDIVVDPDDYSNSNQEKIRFDQTLDYFNVDNYYRLSLNDFIITYLCDLPFSSCIAHLHYVDYLKVFPYLDSNDEVPVVNIPLNPKESFNRVLFTFPKNMYVKPTSLEMSLEAKPGFVTTSYFYLPKNRCEELLDQTFTVVVSEFGHGKISFNWDVKYLNNHHLIGDCSNSDYCVVGEPVNE